MAQQVIDTVGTGDTVQSGGQKINANFSELYPLATVAIPSSEKAAANGVATLDTNLKIPVAQLPAITITDTFPVASEVLMLGLVAQTGDVAIRLDTSETYILKGSNPALLGDWELLPTPTVPVLSVAGKVGTINLVSSDILGMPATMTGGSRYFFGQI